MSEQELKVRVISDPEEVTALFLKDYKETEINHFYEERLHFAGQYTYACDKETMIKLLTITIPRFQKVKSQLLKSIREQHASYEEYHAEIPSVSNQIEAIEIFLTLFYINLNEKASTSEIIQNFLKNNEDEEIVHDILSHKVRIYNIG